MSPPPRPDAGGTSDRVRCAYCGANNFPTSPTCWQCGRTLRPLSVNAQAGPNASPPPMSASPATGGTSAAGTSAAAWIPPRTDGAFGGVDPGLAPKAAAALGMLFPWAAIPIGMVFLMLDDPRKAKLGWIAIGWSVAGTILNVLLFVLPLLGLWPFLKSLISHPGGGMPSGGSGLPSIPSLGGASLIFLRVHLLFMC